VENVFLVGSDNNLYVDHYDPQSGWTWHCQGNPGTYFVGNPTVINYQDSTENIFLTGGDGNLYVNHYDPNGGWVWVCLGNFGVRLVSTPTVTNYNGTSERVFVTGADGNLYLDQYDPGSGWVWSNHNSPGVQFASNPVVIDYYNGFPPGSVYETVFIADVNGYLQADAFFPDGRGWLWASASSPEPGQGHAQALPPMGDQPRSSLLSQPTELSLAAPILPVVTANKSLPVGAEELVFAIRGSQDRSLEMLDGMCGSDVDLLFARSGAAKSLVERLSLSRSSLH
jgi:hypothetical protein